jgi:hypothetical protein
LSAKGNASSSSLPAAPCNVTASLRLYHKYLPSSDCLGSFVRRHFPPLEFYKHSCFFTPRVSLGTATTTDLTTKHHVLQLALLLRIRYVLPGDRLPSGHLPQTRG